MRIAEQVRKHYRIVQSIAGAAFAAVVVVAAVPTPAVAAPSEMFRFHDEGSNLVDDFCGFEVRFDSHDQGVLVARATGPDRLVRYTVSHHGGATATNVATGKSLSLTWNYLEQDVHVTANGDGTIIVVSQTPGPERWYAPDGKILSTDGGTGRLESVFDDAGTPSDPSDDVFISQKVISVAGGKPAGDFDLCTAFEDLTG